MTEPDASERTYVRSASTRAWLRYGGRATRSLGWLLVIAGAVTAALAGAGDPPIYLLPAVVGLALVGCSIVMMAEAER